MLATSSATSAAVALEPAPTAGTGSSASAELWQDRGCLSGCANPSLGMHHASCPNRLGEEPPSPVRSPASSKRSKGRNPSWMAAKSLPDLPGELAKEAAKDEAAALTANKLLSISGNNLNHHRSHKFDMQGGHGNSTMQSQKGKFPSHGDIRSQSVTPDRQSNGNGNGKRGDGGSTRASLSTSASMSSIRGSGRRPRANTTSDFGDTVRNLFNIGKSPKQQLAEYKQREEDMKHALNDALARCAKAELSTSRADHEVGSLKITITGMENATQDMAQTIAVQASELREARAHIVKLDGEVGVARLSASQQASTTEQALAMGSAVKLMKAGLESAHAAQMLQIVDQLDEAKQETATAKESGEKFKRATAELERKCDALRVEGESSSARVTELLKSLGDLKTLSAAKDAELHATEAALAEEKAALNESKLKSLGDLKALAATKDAELAAAEAALAEEKAALNESKLASSMLMKEAAEAIAAAEAKNAHSAETATGRFEELNAQISHLKQALSDAEAEQIRTVSEYNIAVAETVEEVNQKHQDEMAAAIAETIANSNATTAQITHSGETREVRIKEMERKVARLSNELAIEKQSVKMKAKAAEELELRISAQHKQLMESDERYDAVRRQLAGASEDAASKRAGLEAKYAASSTATATQLLALEHEIAKLRKENIIAATDLAAIQRRAESLANTSDDAAATKEALAAAKMESMRAVGQVEELKVAVRELKATAGAAAEEIRGLKAENISQAEGMSQRNQNASSDAVATNDALTAAKKESLQSASKLEEMKAAAGAAAEEIRMLKAETLSQRSHMQQQQQQQQQAAEQYYAVRQQLADAAEDAASKLAEQSAKHAVEISGALECASEDVVSMKEALSVCEIAAAKSAAQVETLKEEAETAADAHHTLKEENLSLLERLQDAIEKYDCARQEADERHYALRHQLADAADDAAVKLTEQSEKHAAEIEAALARSAEDAVNMQKTHVAIAEAEMTAAKTAGQMEGLKAAVTDAKEAQNLLKEENLSQREQLQEAAKRYNTLVQQLAATTDDGATKVQEQLERHAADAAIAATEMLAVERQAVQLQKENADVAARLALETRRADALARGTEDVVALKKALAAAEMTAGRATGQLEGVKAAEAKAVESYAALRAELTQVQNELQAQAVVSAVSKSKVAGASANTARLTHDLDNIRADFAEQKGNVRRLVAELSDAQDQNEKYIAERSQLQDALRVSLAEASTTSDMLEKTSEALGTTSAELKDTKELLAVAQTDLARTNAKAGELENSLQRRSANLDTATTDLRARTEEVRQNALDLQVSEGKLIVAREQAEQLGTLLDESKAAHDQVDKLATALAEAKSDLESKVAVQRTALAAAGAEAEVAASTIAELGKNLGAAEAEAAVLAGKLAESDTLLAAARAELKALQESDLVNQLEEYRQLYMRESKKRKALHNKLRELNGNIRVMCRIRPNPKGNADEEIVTCQDFDHEEPSMVKAPYVGYLHQSCNYEFDRVFGAGARPASQEAVFKESTEPIVTAVLDGYNVAIIAYGQTGTGKTHTMMGTKEDPGVTFRSVNQLLESCKERENIDYTVSVGLLEVYLDKLVDLLSDQPVSKQVCAVKGGKVAGLERRAVTSTEEVFAVMEEGKANRKVASTAMNSESSRSHLVVFINVDGCDKVSGAKTSAKLTLVDLAGSERLDKLHSNGNPKRLAETVSINKSLTALGQVFSNIHSGAKHIPYRNSKLTHVLQEVMTVDTKVCIFIHVSSEEDNLGESLSTMKFGTTIGTIQQKWLNDDGGSGESSSGSGKKTRKKSTSREAQSVTNM